jgi:hypothetical protein
MLCEPTLSEDVVKVATPPLSVAAPIGLPPSRKVTVPVGVPPPIIGDTVAVKVTVWPKTLGFCDDDNVVVVGRWAHAVVGANPIAHITPMASANALSTRLGLELNAPAIHRLCWACHTAPKPHSTAIASTAIAERERFAMTQRTEIGFRGVCAIPATQMLSPAAGNPS